jgi:hypothetical protein
MNTTLLRMARRHFNSDLVPASTNRFNQRQWVKAVRLLGPNWKALPMNPEAKQ